MTEWCAIGDSFTYLNDHLNETGNRVTKGYITRTVSKLERVLGEVHVTNRGIDGASTADFVDKSFAPADFYTVLLGTNDWFSFHIPIGNQSDFDERRRGTILGNLAVILEHIRAVSDAPVFVMNPVERTDFVYVLDQTHVDHGSYRPVAGQTLAQVADAIFTCVHGKGVYPIDLHARSGFTPANAVRFARRKVKGRTVSLPFPEYLSVPFDPVHDEYPYPKEAIGMTYDGLHPSDTGAEILAGILADEIIRVMGR